MKLQYDETLSNFAFNFNLRRYIKAMTQHGVAERAEALTEGATELPDSYKRLAVRRRAVALGATEVRRLLDAAHKVGRCKLNR